MTTERLFKKLTALIVLGIVLAFVNLESKVNFTGEKVVVEKDVTSFVESDVVTSTIALVKRVVDGDTVELESGQKVRYIGVNSPESVDPRRSVQCFGHEASEFNKQMVEGKVVRLVKDVSETDKYGRLLRYVYLDDGTFVNEKLVAEGYAKVSTYPPDVKFVNVFRSAEASARQAGNGLWSKCK